MARNIKARKPPEDFDAAGDDEEVRRDKKPLKASDKKPTKTGKHVVEEDYFASDDEAEEEAETEKALTGKSTIIKPHKNAEEGDDNSPYRPKYITFGEDAMTKGGKKSKTKLEQNKINNRTRLTDSLVKFMVESTRKKYGNSSILVGRETDRLVVGIPMFAGSGKTGLRYPGILGLEFVMCMDIWPLGLVIQLVAKTGVGKSGFLAEVGRWFHMAGGYFNLQECETKFNPEWYRSIMGEKVFDEEVMLGRCRSVEDWQRKNTFSLQQAKRFMTGTAAEPGPGRVFPWLFGVDSIMGKSSELTQDDILGKLGESGERGTTGKGFAGRGFPIEALSITRYMRSIPGELDNWPFSQVLVNHLRIKSDDMGNPERSKAGGEQVGFQESFEIELSKVGGHAKRIESKTFEGYGVQISCEKNSFGPTHRKCQTRVLWRDEVDEETGKRVSRTYWDWDWTTVHLLNSIMNSDKGSPRLKHNLKEEAEFHIACPSVSDIENRAWSRTLGMKEKDAMPWAELGAAIRQDDKLMNRLREALRITRRPRMAGNYAAQLDKLAEEMP